MRPESSPATAAMASSETAIASTSQCPRASEIARGLPEPSSPAATCAPASVLEITSPRCPPAPSHERANAFPARPPPTSASERPTIPVRTEAVYRYQSFDWRPPALYLSGWHSCCQSARKCHEVSGRPNSHDPEGDHPRARGYRPAGLLANALQVQPLRAFAGLHPKHHGRPDGRRLLEATPHVCRACPDGCGLPPVHRRAHAASQGR